MQLRAQILEALPVAARHRVEPAIALHSPEMCATSAKDATCAYAETASRQRKACCKASLRAFFRA
eukprot:4369904-Pleurochrysis_carterae.AAC.1